MGLSHSGTLVLFNEKADRFLRVLKAHGDFWRPGALIAFDLDLGLDGVHVGPDEKTLESAILNLRFFCQDNEPTSLRRISGIYSEVGGEEAERFGYVRTKLNRLLDSSTCVCLSENESEMSHRDLFELFVYGNFAHAGSSPDKRELFLSLRDSPVFPILQTEFCAVLQWWAWALQEIRILNDRLLATGEARADG